MNSCKHSDLPPVLPSNVGQPMACHITFITAVSIPTAHEVFKRLAEEITEVAHNFKMSKSAINKCAIGKCSLPFLLLDSFGSIFH